MKSLKFKVLCFVFLAASGAHADQAVNLDDIVVTPSRMAQRNYKIAANVTVIDQEQIEHSSARTVPDLLKETLGVHVFEKGTPKSSIVDIRGLPIPPSAMSWFWSMTARSTASICRVLILCRSHSMPLSGLKSCAGPVRFCMGIMPSAA